MTINAVDKSVTIPQSDLEAIECYLLHAIRRARILAELPVEGYDYLKVPYEKHAPESAVLDAAKAIGLTMGSQRCGTIDLRDKK
jgi:hypothetical protein